MAVTLDHKTKASDLVAQWADRIAGKTILVTGVSPGGLGDHFVQRISAGSPSTLILAGRTPSKFQSVVDTIHEAHPEIKLKPLALDLASFANVRKAADTVNGWSDVQLIDVIVCNAGIMATPFSLTEDGIESQFQSCHLGHFLLVNLLMDKLLVSPAPRLVSVSSNGHRFGGIRWSDPNFGPDGDGKYYDRSSAYGQAKTANCLFALGLAGRLGDRGLRAYSLHPGVIWTNLANHLPENFLDELAEADRRLGTKFGVGMMQDKGVKDEDSGVSTHVFAAFSPDVETDEINGAYFQDCGLADPWEQDVHSWATSKVDADRLWKLSEKMVKQEFNY